jgi:hypothetical protein
MGDAMDEQADTCSCQNCRGSPKELPEVPPEPTEVQLELPL